MIVNLSKNNKSRNLMFMPNIRVIEKPTFLTPNSKKVFNYLRQTFIKALILLYFDLKSYIQIKTNASSYAISGILNQLKLNYNTLPKDLNLYKFDID